MALIIGIRYWSVAMGLGTAAGTGAVTGAVTGTGYFERNV